MAFLSSFDISGYGLSAQRFRVNMISSNIANANTTRTDEGGPYRRKEVIFKAFDFDEVLNQKLGENNNLLKYEDPLDEDEWGLEPKPSIMSVYVDKVVRDDSQPRMKYEPSHPDANSEGYVAYPNINPVVEMADLIEATRAYQANVSAFQSAKNMASTALTMFQA
ncbi:flagellar basal body rod protein FlgC [Wolinella succinogenes]|jgi:flagellar basal-body rod protein FlgC|uniref:Flagellar basal-body rod protein FlgC n=1 Tax=Wolinella succinogenes (strain ATCC 29543 / DSM 1740 / CCUG 13145 / JCM 31913 / LMG 7466 / NCTC 11488 / FDC 602W) TaxID=273121 RepID=Q7M8G9_WOLSU|nr:flagellar basal body rod protein FlgC [Wolinella succinogenes]NLU34728.1 flagellar basal body rod protein FlgC [Wolinella succinogenes]CAE10695.1 FLAGELLAR BASAL-BODY ROD PROTEIN FLGC PROXIMAL ROD PROTEIN [Wolinella succinogenes]VEG80842.1 Putative proximal rod protein [Wolinella succinogenes]HCZ18631.1 flagellar basal body rod protein FlgC [Helicobacter sp.]